MIGRERPVELGPLDLEDTFVGQAEVMEHDDRLGGSSSTDELDVGEHRWRVALRDHERTPLAGGLDRESLSVDQPNARGERIDAEPRPREVEERERRDDPDVHATVGSQQLDGPLGDERRAGHRVEHLPGAHRGFDQLVHDAGVHRLERRLLLVDAVEARRLT